MRMPSYRIGDSWKLPPLLSLVERKFTWTNDQTDPIWVKLDGFLVNSAWVGVECFPKLIQKSLLRLGSDHVLIRLEIMQHLSNPRPFMFELVWTIIDGFK